MRPALGTIAFTCGIPGSSQVGNYHAAALGAVGADPDKGLECLDGITPEQTMKNMGRIASPGMTGTEKTIVAILKEKSAGKED